MNVRQLPLTLRWPAQQRFETFVAGENAAAVASIENAAVDGQMPWVYVSGVANVGKSHLLLAACARATASGRSAQFLSLRRIANGHEPAKIAESLRSLGGSDVLALDDIDAIAGASEAEHALFDLFNRCKMEKSTLLFSALAPPAAAGFQLPDLISRLSSCTQAPLKPLDDAARREAVRQRAAARGLTFDDAVLDWLFEHTPRDLGSMTTLIERIDRDSLAAKKRITVTFLRNLINRSGNG